jgi:hypothetical protein
MRARLSLDVGATAGSGLRFILRKPHRTGLFLL